MVQSSRNWLRESFGKVPGLFTFFFISATQVLRMFIYGFAIATTEWWKGNKQKIETLMQHSSHGGRQTLWHTLSTNVVMIKQSLFTYRNGYR